MPCSHRHVGTKLAGRPREQMPQQVLPVVDDICPHCGVAGGIYREEDAISEDWACLYCGYRHTIRVKGHPEPAS
jgi:DNA-directed RNA polymerase subunit RPC12/RpoP